MLLGIDVSPAELFDRITILELKVERGTPEQVSVLSPAMARLRDASASLGMPAGVAPALDTLRRCNRILWRLEDRIRAFEHAKDFGTHFVTTARLIYKVNDRRARAKRTINELFQVAADDIKMYATSQC